MSAKKVLDLELWTMYLTLTNYAATCSFNATFLNEKIITINKKTQPLLPFTAKCFSAQIKAPKLHNS